jgi:uncharacterized protein
MQLTEQPTDSRFFIRSLGPASIRIVDEDFSHSLLLDPERGVEPWAIDSVAELTEEAIQPLLAREPDVVLLATGRAMRFPDHALRVEFLRRNIGLEVMTLEAAARTFNILAAEERRVLAAIIWEPAG